MVVFGETYASLYDPWYDDKDYEAEASALLRCFQAHKAESRLHEPPLHVLDLGCGTGRHLEALTDAGHEGVGIERSIPMATLARQRLGARASVVQEGSEIEGASFDLVYALFDVLSYQVTIPAAQDFVRLASSFVRTNGVVVMDCWHQPGVLRDPPRSSAIVRRFEDGTEVDRRVTADLDVVEGVTTVNYEIAVKDPHGDVATARETHLLRSFTTTELSLLCLNAGLKPLAFVRSPGLTGAISASDWHVALIARPH